MSFDKKERIILIGPMGAGKSSIGKSLALVSEKAFVDVDEEIDTFFKDVNDSNADEPIDVTPSSIITFVIFDLWEYHG